MLYVFFLFHFFNTYFSLATYSNCDVAAARGMQDDDDHGQTTGTMRETAQESLYVFLSFHLFFSYFSLATYSDCDATAPRGMQDDDDDRDDEENS